MKKCLPFIILILSCTRDFSLHPDTNNIMNAQLTAKCHDSIVTKYINVDYPDARLTSVSCSKIDTSGYADKWNRCYANYTSSTGSQAVLYVSITVENWTLDSTSSRLICGSGIIQHDWMDSDEAMRIAEENGGKSFREKFPNCQINASLFEPVIPDSRTVWWIRYHQPDKVTFTLTINATTGKIEDTYSSNPW